MIMPVDIIALLESDFINRILFCLLYFHLFYYCYYYFFPFVCFFLLLLSRGDVTMLIYA